MMGQVRRDRFADRESLDLTKNPFCRHGRALSEAAGLAARDRRFTAATVKKVVTGIIASRMPGASASAVLNRLRLIGIVEGV